MAKSKKNKRASMVSAVISLSDIDGIAFCTVKVSD